MNLILNMHGIALFASCSGRACRCRRRMCRRSWASANRIRPSTSPVRQCTLHMGFFDGANPVVAFCRVLALATEHDARSVLSRLSAKALSNAAVELATPSKRARLSAPAQYDHVAYGLSGRPACFLTKFVNVPI